MIYKWQNEHYDYPQLSIFFDKCDPLKFKFAINESTVNQDILLYVHIPFCSSKCVFCNYYKTSHFTDELINSYFMCLKTEIECYAKILPSNRRKLAGIQFGGGTPSVVPFKYYQDLFLCINQLFYIDKEATVSFEGNIRSLNSRSYIEELKQIGINRVSFGVQSLNEEFRRKWGLVSTEREIDQLIELLQEKNICDYNIDLMYNFPNQTINDVLEDIDTAFLKDVKTIDLYSLIVFPNTVMSNIMIKDKSYDLYKSGESVLKFRKMYEKLAENKDIHFSMSNTISKSKSYHYKNLYIQLGQNKLNGGTVIGIGASARGYIGGIAYKNHVEISQYIDQVVNCELSINLMKKLSKSEMEHKLLVMFPNFTFLNKKNLHLSDDNMSRINRLIESGFLKEDEDKYYISKSDFFWAGAISSLFFSDDQRMKMTKSVLYNRKNSLNMYNQDNMNILN